MSRDESKLVVTHLLLCWNSRTEHDVVRVYADNYVGTDLTHRSHLNGAANVARRLARLQQAFPDLHFDGEEAVFEDDRIVLSWSARGTHQGKFFNIPPTGCAVAIHGVSIFRAADGKITHGTHLWDMAALLRQLGLLPELDPNLAL
jgi:steroid delta-isomerase-like uncharacterized protein